MADGTWDTTTRSYLCGEWRAGDPERGFALENPATEEVLAHGSTAGLDLGAALPHARSVGGPALRGLSFAARGEMLKQVAAALHAERDRFIAIAVANGGNTRKDAKYDVDGATGTLQYYATLGATLGERPWLTDGEGVALGRSGRWWGQHALVSRRGAAIHINAYNFPAWGLFEKAAVAWLAGVPVVAKPATATCLLAYEMTRVALASGALPEGVLQLVCGPVGRLLDGVGPQDAIAFTGSAATGIALRGLEAVRARGVAVNVEADSLNAAVLGGDVQPSSETWHLFFNDVTREITQKAGQKCTATRRILVPRARIDEVQAELAARLSQVVLGDPSSSEVGMGPVTSASQRADVRAGIALLKASGARCVREQAAADEPGRGYFVPPTLLRADAPFEASVVHEHEIFGPVATLIPYDGSAAEAGAIVNLGEGGLVASVYSDDEPFVIDVVERIAPFHGRVYIGDEKCAAQTMGPGTVLPMLVHGGPGRAGHGEELGGARGLHFYMQRVAVQGSRRLVDGHFGTT